jgi:hypothetical protein
VSDITEVPETFDLVLDPDGKRIGCETRWRSGFRIGVRFAEPCGLTLFVDIFRS